MTTSPPSVRRNVVANFAGRGWSSLMRLVFLPVYLHYLGIEAFALVGFFTTVTAVLALFDLGLSATLTREMARLADEPQGRQESRDLSRTLEVVYWVVGAAMAAALALLTPAIAGHWLKPGAIPLATVKLAVFAMAGVVGMQWPTSLYNGGLLGLQRHSALNAITAAVATVQGVGAVLVLRFVSPTIAAYFAWQIVATALLVFALRHRLWRELSPAHEAGHLRFSMLSRRWRFAGGMAGIAFASMALTQLDKILLSRMLSLEDFGYYSFAFSVASALSYVAMPVYTAAYPRLVQLASRGDEEASVASLYHTSAQVIATLVIPAAALLATFPRELLLVYSQNGELANRAHLLLTLVSVGIGLNSLMLMPLALQLAHGWTSLSFWKNVVASLAYAPAVYLLISQYGGAGAAVAFILLNIGYMLIEVPLMHRRVLPREMSAWYLHDVLKPAAACIVLALLLRQVVALVPTPLLPLFLLAAAGLLLASAAAVAPLPVRFAWAAFQRDRRA